LRNEKTAVSSLRKICGTKKRPSPAFAKFAEQKDGRFQLPQKMRDKLSARHKPKIAAFVLRFRLNELILQP